MLWLGVDVGGTFTDLVLFDAATGALSLGKTPSTPRDQSEGILAGIAQLDAEPNRAGGGIEQHQIGERAADVNTEPEHVSAQVHRPVNTGLRFSRNARTASR